MVKRTNGSSSPDGGGDDLAGIVRDALTFGVPVITEDGGGPAPEVAPTGAAAAGNRIDNSFKLYLGRPVRRIKPGDLPDLLNRAFTETLVRGHYEYSPRRRLAVGSLAAGGAAVAPELSGAGAVVYTYAQSALTQCKEKLAAFEPLIEVEEEPLETLRSVANADLDDLLETLATEDILPERVDLAFAKLGVDASTRPAGVMGALGQIRDRFGLLVDNVRTVRDEVQVTEFALMIDLLASLRRTWDTNRQFFTTRDAKASLGRKIWLLERWQGIAMERAEAVNAVLQQSGLDAASIELKLTFDDPTTGKPKKTQMFFSDLMAWTQTMLQEGLGMPAESDEIGRDEAISFEHTIREVHALVAAAAADTGVVQLGGVGLPTEYRWYRIRVSLNDLANALAVIASQVAGIARPPFNLGSLKVERLSLTTDKAEQIYSVTVRGNRLPDDPSVALMISGKEGAGTQWRVTANVLVIASDRNQIRGLCGLKTKAGPADAKVTVTDSLGEQQSSTVRFPLVAKEE